MTTTSSTARAPRALAFRLGARLAEFWSRPRRCDICVAVGATSRTLTGGSCV